jgi:predicted nucleotide-binding protein
MSEFDPFDPFGSLPRQPAKEKPGTSPLDALLPPPRPQPPAELLAKLLSSEKEEPLNPERLKAIQRMIETNNPSPTTPQESLTKKLRIHVTTGLRLIEEKKVQKQNGVPWLSRLKTLLESILGESCWTKHIVEFRNRVARDGLPIEEFSREVRLASDFVELLEQTANSAVGCLLSRASRTPATSNVFIIHGKDELNSRRLSDHLRDEGLNPVVMMAQPGMSRPLSDKFEEEASKCAFAFALFTADDVIQSGSKEYYQARPNVIYETGWFVGRLGKSRIAPLLQDGAEMHTDLQGISRIHFDQDVREKSHDIRRELKGAGLVH